MRTIILVVKHRLTVKELIAFSITHQSYPESTEKKTRKATPTPSETASFWTLLLSEFSLPSVGRVWMDIFLNYTIPIRPGDLAE